jgi:2-hydroxychromene-2-carboxylate isomerase
MNVEFWFDFASTYSYPAAMRIEDLAHEAGASLLWRPFLLGPIFQQQGWETSPFNIYPAKGRYMWRDLERLCDRLAIPFRKPAVFPRNGLLAARVACRFAEASWIGAFVRAVFRANFGDDRDIATVEVIYGVLADLGQDGSSVLNEAHTQESKARLRRQTESAMKLGIFGAPTFRVDDELFWGNDRLEHALDWHRRAAR